MSGYDIFAWIVLVILLAVIVPVFWRPSKALPAGAAATAAIYTRRRQGQPHHPPRAASAGRDPQHHQSVLRE